MLRHSNEHVPPQTVCTICRENFSEHDDVLITACSHRFHRNCLMSWLKRNSSCPQCRATCSSRDFHTNTDARTRSRMIPSEKPVGNASGCKNLQSAGENIQQAQQSQSEGAACLPGISIETTSGGEPPNANEEVRVRNLVAAFVAARQASMLEGLENRVTQIIEQKIESALTNLIERLNLNPAQPPPSGNDASQAANIPAAPLQPNMSLPRGFRDIPPMPSHSNLNFSHQIDQLRFSDLSSIPHSSRIAQLISSWDVKFDGTSRLSVDSFLSRI